MLKNNKSPIQKKPRVTKGEKNKAEQEGNFEKLKNENSSKLEIEKKSLLPISEETNNISGKITSKQSQRRNLNIDIELKSGVKVDDFNNKKRLSRNLKI